MCFMSYLQASYLQRNYLPILSDQLAKKEVFLIRLSQMTHLNLLSKIIIDGCSMQTELTENGGFIFSSLTDVL